MSGHRPLNKRCQQCNFSATRNDGKLECHRNPPVRQYSSKASQIITLYPEVKPDDWCGEWQKQK